MAKNDNEKIVGMKPVSMSKKFIQPVSITNEFSSYVCFKHMELDKVVRKNGKDQSMKEIERMPLMLTWDGKELKSFICKRGQDIRVGDENYIIDRDIDDNPMLPDEDFIARLMSPAGKKMINDFNAKDFFNEIHDYLERYFYLEKEYLRNIITLFVVNLWVFDAHESTPYMLARSPVMGCGKSHLGESITQMCNGQMNTNFKAHHLFRIVHGTKTIPAFDEIKKWTDKGYKMGDDTKDIISLVNVGFQKGGSKVPRLIESSNGRGEMKTILYDSFSPKIMITTTGQLPRDTASRCIEIILQRAPPKGIDFGDRWYEPARKKTLKKIREMGLLFRLKHGQEILGISENVKWRQELDTAKVFKGLRNRQLEIFRPLVILTLKYMPEWKDMTNVYVRKYTDMKAKLEPTPIDNVLWAMRSLFNEAFKSPYKEVEYAEWGAITIKEDEINGELCYFPLKAIAGRIFEQTSLNIFGDKGVESKIGKVLNDLGFTTGKERTALGTVRIVKVKQLEDMVDRYLAVTLTGGIDKSLDLAQKVDLIKNILLDCPDGMVLEAILVEVNALMKDRDVEGVLKHLVDIGDVTKRRLVYTWTAK